MGDQINKAVDKAISDRFPKFEENITKKQYLK
jgi:hypothetical protein